MDKNEGCTHDCGSCGQSCGERNQKETDFRAKPNELSDIKRVIGIVSGKGGVGKSAVTSMLAVQMRRRGYETAVLDADVTGPSIPKMFGLKQKAAASELGIFPVVSKSGISVMSINVLLDDEQSPVVWRGPVIAGTVKQFWTDVVWGKVDYMFVDMPPGTGDVPLTAFQSLPIDGLIIVTSPQELVSMIVAKAVRMAEMMSIPVVGLVENLSYFVCPDNGKAYNVFGESHIDEIAEKHGLNILVKLPIDPKISAACDSGMIELFDSGWFEPVAKILESEGEKH